MPAVRPVKLNVVLLPAHIVLLATANVPAAGVFTVTTVVEGTALQVAVDTAAVYVVVAVGNAYTCVTAVPATYAVVAVALVNKPVTGVNVPKAGAAPYVMLIDQLVRFPTSPGPKSTINKPQFPFALVLADVKDAQLFTFGTPPTGPKVAGYNKASALNVPVRGATTPLITGAVLSDVIVVLVKLAVALVPVPPFNAPTKFITPVVAVAFGAFKFITISPT